jgi:hypothetical protein
MRNNKKDKEFLLVEIRIAIQRESYYCFHAQVYYNPNWFICIWPLHYFPVAFTYWSLSLWGYCISSCAVGTSNTFKFWVS